MSAEIRILRPEFRPGPLPLEFMVQVTCGDCGQPPRTLSLTRSEAQALHLALANLPASGSVTTKVFTEKEFAEEMEKTVNVEGGCE